MKRKYERAYRPEWEQDPLLSSWLPRAKDDRDVAFCKACNCELIARLSTLKEHGSSQKHKKNITGYSSQSSVQQFFKKSPLEEVVKKAELNFCAMLVEHSLPFRLMDHLSEIICKSFHDSEIAKLFSCKRTKAAAVTYNVLQPNLEAETLADLKSCENIKTGKVMFSLIIDETIDITITSMLAVVTKYYSEKDLQVKTKFLTLVDLNGADAQSLFDALSKALTDANLDIKDAIGFGADTTNVMFEEQGGVIAKIRHVNPHCMFIKCVCHSTALCVSHASKNAIPRAINQIVQKVYGYFAHSSKRQKEFIEYQDFIGTEKHKILRHYEIRWLRDYTFIHTAFKDISEVYMCLLSWYMKANYLKTTDPLSIDPKSTVNFLSLKDIYLGVSVNTEIDRLLVHNFPNIVDESNIQKVDVELRQIKFDISVRDLLESGGSSTASTILSADKFWGAIGKMLDANGATKYPNIAKFAKALLCLPMSNASCERIFSQVNLNKTRIRNRFLNKHVSAIIITKEGIKEHGDCVSFKPSKNMLKNMSFKSIHTENEDENLEANVDTN
ncbi:unnamed protein product [Euphydryas editha]|uniref:HAT C-terminal dimerisation domain-containing protein n=1 Tax=Euphydryas editha TaxID=104508 RepID=A0AAU9U150_EUPED|nr:unnamed protein product [Euphydryas editha]